PRAGEVRLRDTARGRQWRDRTHDHGRRRRLRPGRRIAWPLRRARHTRAGPTDPRRARAAQRPRGRRGRQGALARWPRNARRCSISGRQRMNEGDKTSVYRTREMLARWADDVHDEAPPGPMFRWVQLAMAMVC